MKVLHVYKTYVPDTIGGVENFIDQLIISGSSLGVEAEVFTLTKERKASTITINNYKVHKIPFLFQVLSTPISFVAFYKFYKMAKKADVIHFHFPWPIGDAMYFIAKIFLRKKLPYIITYHSDIVKQFRMLKVYAPLMNLFLSNADAIVSSSPNYTRTSSVLQKFSQKVYTIPIGLDEDTYISPRVQTIDFWKDKINQKFFLYIGSMRYYKGLDYLIEAAKGIDLSIVIIGSGEPQESLLKKKAAQLGIHNIYFLGNVNNENKIALLKLCYGVILPSNLRSEAFGISLLEGAMYGKPLISCEIGTGTTYINLNKETGLVIPPADVMALQNALNYLIQNPQEALRMGKNARQRYLKFFQAKTMAQSYYSLYQNLT